MDNHRTDNSTWESSYIPEKEVIKEDIKEEAMDRTLGLPDKEATEEVKDERTPRTLDVRKQRLTDSWAPSSNLPTPNPKDGWTFRWIRVSSLGNADNTNVSKKFREGWEPVKASDHPELFIETDIDSQFEDSLQVGGLLLCKAPEELMVKRREYFANMSAKQIESVDRNYMKENDPRMPLLAPERKTRTEFGRS